jgi:uncharacterized membrane protein
MILASSFISWEFAPQVFFAFFIIAIGLWTTIMCEVDRIGIYSGQTWENHFDQRKAKIISVTNGNSTQGKPMVIFLIEGEHLERRLPEYLFKTQYKRISLR